MSIRYLDVYININQGGEPLFYNNLFKALSDPTRREILKMLKEGDMTAGDIADRFNISKPSISHHLNILKQATLVQDERQGQFIHYCLNTTVFQDLMGWFYDILKVKDEEASEDDDKKV